MNRHIVSLCGGVGGSKLAFGLNQILKPEQLSIIVNTGDDFDHLGLRICPDIDTVLYTLAGQSDDRRGWGLADESWSFFERVKELGGQGWFQLGDRDLATHVLRTHKLNSGATLTEVTEELRGALSVGGRILPMSDHPVGTCVETIDGILSFQHYFVLHQARPVVKRISFVSPESSLSPAPAATGVLKRMDLQALIVCPSNPYLSIDPILALDGMRDSISRLSCPVIAVSPVVGGAAIKGPMAKIMSELGIACNPVSIARHYVDIIDAIVIDDCDRAFQSEIENLGVRVVCAPIVMGSASDRVRLAETVLDFAGSIVTLND